MPDYSSGEIKPTEAVLGLIAQGRTTVAGLRARLDRAFPHANYAPNTVTNALPRLTAKGHIRLVKHGGDDDAAIYEITREGMTVFEDWLYEIASIPTPQRDAIQAKLAFLPAAGADGIARFLAIIKVLEDAAACEYGAEHGKIKTLHLSGSVADNPDLELECIQRQYTANRWGYEAKALAHLRKSLEAFEAKHGAE